mgnify:CR=1 FL=1
MAAENVCRECGQEFDAAETERMYGEEFSFRHPGFCSTDCYRNSLTGPAAEEE